MLLPQRRSLRLPGYDYSQAGAYFVTFCTHRRAHLLGRVDAGHVHLSAHGETVTACLQALPERFPAVEVDAFVVMPNHVHVVLWLAAPRTGQSPVPTGLGGVVGAWKSLSAKAINAARGTPGGSVWQQRFYEHVIRSDEALGRIRSYIHENPSNWARDRFFR